MIRHAFPAPCPTCGHEVLTTDWDYTDLMPCYHGTRRADPTAINPTIEAACIILARPTYNLHHRAGKPHLTRRDPEWHHWHHHGPPDHVLPAHQCGRPLPGTPINIPTTEPALEADDTQHPF